jgi:hypothetical protein
VDSAKQSIFPRLIFAIFKTILAFFGLAAALLGVILVKVNKQGRVTVIKS